MSHVYTTQRDHAEGLGSRAPRPCRVTKPRPWLPGFGWRVHLAVLLALAGWVFQSVPAHAGRIFLLVAADTSADGKIALSTGPDTKFIRDVFFAMVPREQLVIYNWPRDNPEGGPPQEPIWAGPDIHRDLADMKEKLITAIQNCPAGPDDAVVFFYSGHGGYDDWGHFVQMPGRQARLYRGEIIQAIRRKKPRLTVVLTDTCNTRVGQKLPLLAPCIYPPEQIAPLFDQLFMKSRGVADINSCSKDEAAPAPAGGGLLALAVAYMGGPPRFDPVELPTVDRFLRDAVVEPVGGPRAILPPVDYNRVLIELSRTALLTDPRDMRGPPYGFLWANADRRLTWKDFQEQVSQRVRELFSRACPEGLNGGTQRSQNPQFFSLPSEWAGPPPSAGRWSRPIYRPEIGDHIAEVNGKPIRSMKDFFSAVKNSPPVAVLRVIDQHTGNPYVLRTTLNPPGAPSRLGIVACDCCQRGVRVLGWYPDSPGTRCQLAR